MNQFSTLPVLLVLFVPQSALFCHTTSLYACAIQRAFRGRTIQGLGAKTTKSEIWFTQDTKIKFIYALYASQHLYIYIFQKFLILNLYSKAVYPLDISAELKNYPNDDVNDVIKSES